jgi:hypothetical protein
MLYCYIILCYIILYYVMLCYVMLCYIILYLTSYPLYRSMAVAGNWTAPIIQRLRRTGGQHKPFCSHFAHNMPNICSGRAMLPRSVVTSITRHNLYGIDRRLNFWMKFWRWRQQLHPKRHYVAYRTTLKQSPEISHAQTGPSVTTRRHGWVCVWTTLSVAEPNLIYI